MGYLDSCRPTRVSINQAKATEWNIGVARVGRNSGPACEVVIVGSGQNSASHGSMARKKYRKKPQRETLFSLVISSFSFSSSTLPSSSEILSVRMHAKQALNSQVQDGESGMRKSTPRHTYTAPLGLAATNPATP